MLYSKCLEAGGQVQSVKTWPLACKEDESQVLHRGSTADEV